MYEIYVIIGCLLILCGFILISYQTYSIYLKNSSAQIFSEALRYIAIGSFYIYCSIQMDPIFSLFTNKISNDQNNITVNGETWYEIKPKILKSCDFTKYFMENAAFICSFIHSFITIVTEIVTKKVDQEPISKSKKSIGILIPWIIPLISIFLLLFCNQMVNTEPTSPGTEFELPVNQSEVTNTVKNIYKIVFESSNQSIPTNDVFFKNFFQERIRKPKSIHEDCEMNHKNYMKLYTFALLIFGYFLPLILSAVYRSFGSEDNHTKQSLLAATIFWSPGFFEMCLRNFMDGSNKTMLSDVLRNIANGYYLIRARNLIKLMHSKPKFTQVNPLVIIEDGNN